MITKICPQCGEHFLTEYKTQKFCSKACYGLSLSRKVQLTCPYCNKVVWVHKGTKFCSKKCADSSRRGVKRSPVVMKTCPVCNKVFESKYESHTFCSKECGNVGRRPATYPPLSEEEKLNRSNRLKKRWEDPEFRKSVVDRMKENNPVHMPSVVEKANATKSKNNSLPNNFKYGNGKISPYECLVKDKLEQLGFIYNYPIVTRYARKLYPEKCYPNCYKPDFVNLDSKLCIEIDGHGHSSTKEKMIDAKKEECLNILGYQVVRFTHDDIDGGVFDQWLNSYQNNM